MNSNMKQIAIEKLRVPRNFEFSRIGQDQVRGTMLPL